MGCYDFFTGTCPACNTAFSVQTKLVGDDFTNHMIGSKLGFEGSIELKEPCECGSTIVAVFESGILSRYATGGATCKEGMYGALLQLDDSAEAQFDREVMSKIDVKSPV